METKLTLKLDKKIIKEAKQFADQNLKVTPFVKSISTGIKVPSGLKYLNFLAKSTAK